MTTPLLLPPGEVQFCDANGKPYAGGSVSFFIWGTDTPKDTWQDHLGSSLNTNPVILDAAGRAIIFGDGDYRMILKDADGNLIYDQWTSTVISDVMLPVVSATSLAAARDALGVTAAIQAETDRATAAEGTLTTNLASEVSRAEAAEAHLQSEIDAITSSGTGVPVTQHGSASTDSSGHTFVTFPTAFSSEPSVVCQLRSSTVADTAEWIGVEATATGFDAYSGIPLADWTVHPQAVSFYWIAVGPG